MEQTAIQILIEKYNKQWEKYGMGSSISYSELIADLEQTKEIEKQKMCQFAFDYQDEFFDKVVSTEEFYNETFKSE